MKRDSAGLPTMKLLRRLFRLFTSPLAEWQQIDREDVSLRHLYVGWLLPLVLLVWLGLIFGQHLYDEAPALHHPLRLTKLLVLLGGGSLAFFVQFTLLALVAQLCAPQFGGTRHLRKAFAVVGYAMADNMKTDLICKAIDMAVRRCPHQEEVTIFHSDRGSQYTSQQFAKHLKNYKILPSVGRTGVCWDNAWAESFNATLKNERVYQMVYPTRSKAIRDIASWIELEYNQKRLHSALGYRTPNEVEEEHRATRQAA